MSWSAGSYGAIERREDRQDDEPADDDEPEQAGRAARDLLEQPDRAGHPAEGRDRRVLDRWRDGHASGRAALGPDAGIEQPVGEVGEQVREARTAPR